MVMIPQLIVYHHLGLGDHIICNGMVHWINHHWADEIWLPALDGNFESVQRLYSMQPKVKVVSLQDVGGNTIKEIVQINNMSTQFSVPMLKISQWGNTTEFDRRFYDSLGIDFQVSHDWFTPVPEDDHMKALHETVTKGLTEYCLIHDTASIGKKDLKITTDLPQIRIEKIPGYTLFDWTKTILEAKEIHCIDSSAIHMVDRLHLNPETKLHYHDIGRPSKFTLLKEWNKVSYQ